MWPEEGLGTGMQHGVRHEMQHRVGRVCGQGVAWGREGIGVWHGKGGVKGCGMKREAQDGRGGVDREGIMVEVGWLDGALHVAMKAASLVH